MPRFLLLIILGALAPTPSFAQEAEPSSAQVVDAFREAALAKDIESLVTLFPPGFSMVHVMGERFTQDLTRREWIRILQEAPDRSTELIDRITEGPFVFDYYRITEGGNSTTTMFMFEVQEGRIVNLWHFDPASVAAKAAEERSDP